MPSRIARLPVARGYPVPWFVAWLDDDGRPVADRTGTPEFRVTKPGAAWEAHTLGICWVCGQPLGSHKAFMVGPMCTVNRNSIEPPLHLECAEWSARGCPFMARPHMARRDLGLPEGTESTPGMIARNPGVMAVWVVRRYSIRAVIRSTVNPGKIDTVYFDISEPDRVDWWREGRTATRAEVDASLASGLPALEEIAGKQGSIARAILARQVELARAFLPAEVPVG